MDIFSSNAISAPALSGIRAATLRLDKAAESISARSAAAPQQAGRDETIDLVDLIVARTDFAANVAVLRTGDQMMGALLDIVV
jgi:flagellar basal body rod protein FlgC